MRGTGGGGGADSECVGAPDDESLRVGAEPREEKVADLKTGHPDIEFVAGYQDILDRDDIDLVVGTLPHWLHCQAAIDCVNAGKHVYLEKPMALNVKECDEMLAAARANGRLLLTAHTPRYYGEHINMKEILDSCELGEAVIANAM